MMAAIHATACPQCGASLSQAVAGGSCFRCLAAAIFREEPPPEETAAEPVSERYEITGRLGRGAMGVVYRARQKGLDRDVALKLLPQAAFASEEERERFRREARILASLRHPDIVAVYEAFEDAGCLGFAMECVEGGDLAALTAAGPLPQRTAATLMARIAEAIAYAHTQGVLHRDLKPSNVLLGADGGPKVTDFGLARLVAGAGGGTATGAALGTPAYAPPEQLLGGTDPAPAGDVYGLGALLYHLLTGRAPFVADNPLSLLRIAEEGNPTVPRLLVPSVSRDLETICLHAMERDPGRRYPNAAAFADDLRAFLEGRPISARPTPPMEKWMRWARRRPLVAALAGLTVLLLAGIVTVLARSSGHSRALLHTIREGAYVADMRLTERALEEGNLFEANRLLGKWSEASEAGPDLRGFEWRVFREMTRSHHQVMRAGLPPMRRLAWSLDGTRLFAGSEAGDLFALDPAHELRDTARASLGASINVLTPAPDGTSLLVATADGGVSLRDEATLAAAMEGRAAEAPITAAFDADGASITVVHRTGITRLRRSDGSTVLSAPIQPPPWFFGAIAPDGNHLALAHAGIDQVSVWPLHPSTPLTADTRSHAFNMLAAVPAFTPDSQRLAIARFDGRIALRPIKATGVQIDFTAHDGPVTCVTWNHDGSRLASSGKDQWVKIWDGTEARLFASLAGHTATINSLAFSPDGSRLASASRDGSIRIWPTVRTAADRPASATDRDPFTGWPDALPGFPSTPCWPVTGLVRGALAVDAAGRLWSAEPGASTWTELASLPPEFDARAVRVSPDGRWLLANINHQDKMPPREAILRLRPGVRLEPALAASHQPGCSGVFSPDSRFVVQASLTGDVSIIQLHDGPLTPAWRVARAHQAIINHLAFSSDSTHFASASSDGTAKLWRTTSPDSPTHFSAGASSLWCVAVSQDLTRLAAAADGGRVHLWDVTRRLPVARLQLPTEAITLRLAFGPNDSWLGAAGNGWQHTWPAPHAGTTPADH